MVITAGTLLKMAWSFRIAGESAWAIVSPVTLGTRLCAGVLLLAVTEIASGLHDWKKMRAWKTMKER